MTDANKYVEMAAINVNDFTKKKGKFTYLSWSWAVDQLLRNDPSATWSYGTAHTFADGSMMVYCTVHAFGKDMTMQLPVLSGNNAPIKEPNSFDVNRAMQRCLVKAIALHGIGLYIYSGEDIPTDEEEPEFNVSRVEQLKTSMRGCKNVDELRAATRQAIDEAKAADDKKAVEDFKALGTELSAKLSKPAVAMPTEAAKDGSAAPNPDAEGPDTDAAAKRGPPASATMIKMLRKVIDGSGGKVTEASVAAHFKVEDLAVLDKVEAAAAIKFVNDTVNA